MVKIKIRYRQKESIGCERSDGPSNHSFQGGPEMENEIVEMAETKENSKK